MEETNVDAGQDQNPANGFSDYWQSIVLVGAIFSIISFALSLFFGYRQINAEPSGAIFSPMMFSGVVICLITCVAGAIAVWHYTKEVSPFIKLGQGALVGFLTGAVIVLVSVVLNEVWTFIDPEYTDKLVEAAIANVEAMDMPSSTRDDMIDTMAESVRSSQSLTQQLFWGIPVTGLLNLISGMIGAKIFGKKEDESF
ncbi:DUF4199 domain-containing protein [Rhodohalobacter mucosus]|uniref:DUF4199 domain-containing protein n=1 Tax=Rhodohalobacter mucosus TaxID=2079485 RepID=A0A316TUI1_9BACT|nr:DUF4199 domain-containing protein [Rhodohalobacter mucosus]PWN08157.1 hypothetical protein DDZ15_00540 [Rhodohalobacter mucosus]